MRLTALAVIAALVVLVVLGDVAAHGAVAAQGAVATRTLPDMSGFWELSFDSRRVPAASLAPAITPALLGKQTAHDADAIRWCNFLGLPAAMDSPRPINIRQGRREIVINFETVATPRHLYFRAAHPNMEIFDPTTNGDSIARWDGDALIVDTIGFDGAKGLTMIPGGGYRTSESHLVERFRLLNDATVLSVTSTWEDAKVFRTPHTYEFRYQRAPRMYETQPPLGCNPFDEQRAAFLTGGRP
ncbi:MAG TPA: hypothetical protein VKA59_19715 [Vicinamibacterales bacterium]|nr:hypothetical protein [Vicinamibacterales bacterium]